MDAEFDMKNSKSHVLPSNPQAAKTLTLIIYILQAISLVTGLPLFVAVIINYIKKADVKGTWLESHFRWQIRSFWFSVLWSILGALTLIIGIGYIILFIDMLWLIYRIAKGWLNLTDGKTMYSN